MPSYAFNLTTIGANLIAAAATSGVPLVIANVAIGSGDGTTLTAASTTLISEQYRTGPSTINVVNGVANLTAVIPSTTGGFTISEIGLFDAANNLIAYAAFPPTYKPALGGGLSQYSLTVTCQLAVSSTNVLTITAAAGNPFGSAANGGGNTTITGLVGALQTFILTVTGAAIRTSVIALGDSTAGQGNRLTVYVALPAFPGITLNFCDGSVTGTQVASITTDGNTPDAIFEFYYNAGWKLLRASSPAYPRA
jgi:hypothetical protein